MAQLPLAGIRVLDLGHEWSCPHSARFLADFGAEVIKIEYPSRLDFLRGGKTHDRHYDQQVSFWQVHRNKKSLTLDLRNPSEKEIFEDLVAVSDIVLENSRPGVMANLGLSYDRLQDIKPDIILVSMSAFGRTGPEASYRGYGGTIEAITGIQSLTGYDAQSTPRRIKEMDVTNGIMGACAALTALIRRQETHQGDWVDLSETEAASHGLIGEHLMAYAANGHHPYPLGNRHLEFAPQGCYPCQGEDSWLALTVQQESEWQALCQILGRPEWLQEPRYRSAQLRHRHHDELDAHISTWTQTQTAIAACEQLQSAGIAAGPVMTMADLCKDEHLLQRDYYQIPESAPEQGRYLGFPFRLSQGDGQLLNRGPDLGAHNHEIICELLNRPKQDIPTLDEAHLGTSLDPL